MTFIEFTLVSHDVAKSRNSKCAEKRTTNFRHLLRTLKLSIDTCMFTFPKEQRECKSKFGVNFSLSWIQSNGYVIFLNPNLRLYYGWWCIIFLCAKMYINIFAVMTKYVPFLTLFLHYLLSLIIFLGNAKKKIDWIGD